MAGYKTSKANRHEFVRFDTDAVETAGIACKISPVVTIDHQTVGPRMALHIFF